MVGSEAVFEALGRMQTAEATLLLDVVFAEVAGEEEKALARDLAEWIPRLSRRGARELLVRLGMWVVGACWEAGR